MVAYCFDLGIVRVMITKAMGWFSGLVLNLLSLAVKLKMKKRRESIFPVQDDKMRPFSHNIKYIEILFQ